MASILIAAIAKNGVIGYQGHLPWVVPEETAWFRKRIRGHRVLMGRKTFVRLPNPLQVKTVGILGRNIDDHINDNQIEVFRSIEEVFKYWGTKNFLVIGGGEIYRTFLPLVDRLELNFIQKNYRGDVFFPVKLLKDWRISNLNARSFKTAKVLFTVWQRKR